MAADRKALIDGLDGELIVDLTRQLVAMPTVNPPGDEKACALFIHETLSAWGIESELVLAPEPERPQVVAWHRGAGDGPTLILNGHMDTVGPGDLEAWTHSPFDAKLDGDRLYGLGSADMKGALAVAMAVMKRLHETRPGLSGSVMFQAVIGEEMDEPGTRTLLEQGYRGDFAIVLEPTDLQIGPCTRGACWHRITVGAPAVHCGFAPADFTDTMDFLRHFATALASHHHRVAGQKHHLMASPACRITRIDAGTAHNATSGRAEIMVDRRMLPHETFEQVTRELHEILEETRAVSPGTDFSIAYVAGNEPTETALDDPLIRSLERSIQEVTGSPARVWGPPYGSDMRNFVFDANIPATNFGAGDFRVCHQPDEWVRPADLVTCGKVVLSAICDLLE